MAKTESLLSRLPQVENFQVKMKLYDINGEYAEKEIELEEPIYDVTDKRKMAKLVKQGYQQREMQQDGTTNTVLVRSVKKRVHAFPRNKLNQPLIPLGTTRGYISGALVAISRSIGVRQGEPLYGILSWIRNGGLKITPYWVSAKAGEVKTANYFVKEAKQAIYYEQIPETEVTINVEVVPRNGFDAKLVKELLKRSEGVGISPKRRGRYEILEFS